MARFFGKVGYGTSVETEPDVWSDSIIERDYFGKYLERTVSDQESDKVNDDSSLSSRISIVADPYALGNFTDIKYVIDEVGVCWEVTSRQLKRPRLILSTGGIWHGATAQPTP